ncbi:hypothetical protein WG66_008672 [Moniliophthora roreri]|uniref:Uncharacterized protein n=1 Tax=Moniliophthora roreri TaxID=221103 RepID=A0A0W0EZQ4_MONRR|nr:hypothetical protein WG66_008672 [Moniliophthora roreri]
MQELNYKDHAPLDELFLERFEAFMEKCLIDLRAFSEREERPYEEMRIRAAEWHSNYLFSPREFVSTTTDNNHIATDKLAETRNIRNILIQVSRVLESLNETCGMQSFFLAVIPHDPTSEGFLGGTVEGREFWRGLRGGGEHGATTFKQHCTKQMQVAAVKSPSTIGTAGVAPSNSTSSAKASPKQSSAKSVKLELYESVRKALRSVSGIRNAEMKWTQPDRLYTYGVRLVGWPPDIPTQNPSSLNSSQNKRLLELLQSGTMKFIKTLVGAPTDMVSDTNQEQLPLEQENHDDLFTWININGDPPCDSGEVRPAKKLRISDSVV